MPLELGRVGFWVSSRLFGDHGGEAARVAGELEELGIPALWLGSANPDLELVSQLLQASQRLVVATGIVSIWAAPAAVLASNVARVTTRHPDRFLLGLGVSHAPGVEQSGQRYVRPYQKMVAYLDELDAASPPVPKDLRVLAALGPRMLRLAAERSAGAHPYLVTPEHTRRAREILGPEPLLAPEQMVVVETDPRRAREIARATLARYLQLPNYTNNFRRLGFTEEDLAGRGSDALVDGMVAWGTPEQIEARVREHHEAGADHVAVQVLTAPDATGPPREQWRLLAPALTR
ncbi:MAG TPA: LLM class F420-dependent oxidoreductase [Actinomycetota bacterium]